MPISRKKPEVDVTNHEIVIDAMTALLERMHDAGFSREVIFESLESMYDNMSSDNENIPDENERWPNH